MLESVYNNKVVQENLKKTGIKYETINEFIPITFNLLNKLFSDQDRILSSIELFQSLKQTKITNEQLTSFLVELASAGIGVKIYPSIFDERIKQALALTLSTMPITINPQDFYNQITDSIKCLPPEWQKKINISKSQVNEHQFDNIILKYKQQEAEILLNTSAKLLHKNSFIIQDIANAISPTFETLLNTQLKELNYNPLQITLIGVDNAGAIFKDSILMLSKLSQTVSTNLVRDDSEILSILSTVYKFQMLDNKILNLNDTLLYIQKADPKNKNKINSIYKQLNTYNKEKNQMLLNGIKQFSNLIKKYNSQELLFQDLSEFFEKHHSSIDLILKNAMSQEGILTEYLDINSKQMIAIVKDNNERLLSISNHLYTR